MRTGLGSLFYRFNTKKAALRDRAAFYIQKLNYGSRGVNTVIRTCIGSFCWETSEIVTCGCIGLSDSCALSLDRAGVEALSDFLVFLDK